jgi:orotate phosphoribosyltransferase
MRRLLVTRRRVPLDRFEDYDKAWAHLRDAAAESGGRAWRFRASELEDQFLEFLEWTGAIDLEAATTELRHDLDQIAIGTTEPWTEAMTSLMKTDASPGNAGTRSDADPDHQMLLMLLRERSLTRGDFVLSSGRRSSYYIDARITTMSGKGQVLIGRLGLARLDALGWAPDLVGGLTLGADPIAYAIAHAAALQGRRLDAFTVRKEVKSHGAGRQIEGTFTPGARVVVVEDTITTGDSALRAAAVIQEAGGVITGVLALVDRQEGGTSRIEEAGFPVSALFTTRELLGSGE